MFTIKKKIIFSNLAVVIFASALIAIPVINMQMTTIKENVTDNANAQVAQACAKINSFLLKPSTIVNDMAVFVSSHDIEQSEAEQAFDAAIKGDGSLYSLYFADTVPMRNGGIMYSNDGWNPGPDYGKTSREWYAKGIRKLSETSASQSKKISAELSKIHATISEVVASSKVSSQSFKEVNDQIMNTDQLVRQIRAAMEEQQVGSQQIVDSLKVMNDGTSEVRTASHEMAEGNRLILDEIHNLQESTGVIKESVNEMSAGAQEINKTGNRLAEISSLMRTSVQAIGDEIDLFKA